MTKNIFTIEDLANYTGWSKSYIYKKTSDGTLEFSKPLGKTIFFCKDYIDKFLLSKMNRTKEQLENRAIEYVSLKKGDTSC